jgi:hypothetical protein
VEGWLNALTGMPPQICLHCGRPMTQKFATFFLAENDKSWTMPLPICASCDPAVGQILAVA